MIQKIREAERDALFDEYTERRTSLSPASSNATKAAPPPSPCPTPRPSFPRANKSPAKPTTPTNASAPPSATFAKGGSRVKIILSRTRPSWSQRLFEQEIPEIADGVIEIKAMAREPGYRTKVAVSSTDQRVDCVGACVGVRGNRIKNIVDELGGERIDIVRWSDDMQVLIPNALQPAEVDEVILCPMLGRAIVLVREDQLSLAIGRRGQNVRLASKLCGWDIEIMTREELEDQLNGPVAGFTSLEGSRRIGGAARRRGLLSYDDLSVIEPADLMEMGNLSQEDADRIVSQAEAKAEEAEKAAAIERRRQREQGRADEAQAKATAAAEAVAVRSRSPTRTRPAEDERRRRTSRRQRRGRPEEMVSEEESSEEALLADPLPDETSPDETSPAEASLAEPSDETPRAEPAEGDHEPQGN